MNVYLNLLADYIYPTNGLWIGCIWGTYWHIIIQWMGYEWHVWDSFFLAHCPTNGIWIPFLERNNMFWYYPPYEIYKLNIWFCTCVIFAAHENKYRNTKKKGLQSEMNLSASKIIEQISNRPNLSRYVCLKVGCL
jgi:hypothetical protein